MRRKEREVTDEHRIDEIFLNSKVCRLGFYDSGEIYVVPMNFGYCKKNSEIVLYFHSAKLGRKIDLIHKNNSVGFELDSNYGLIEGEKACDYSILYESIIGNGVISIVDDYEEKLNGLQCIMKHNTKKSDWEFDEHSVDRVCVMKLVVSKFTCKEYVR